MDIITAVIVAFITAVIGPIAMTWVKNKLERKKQDPLAEAIEHNALIDHQVDNLFDQLALGSSGNSLILPNLTCCIKYIFAS